jgi:transposase
LPYNRVKVNNAKTTLNGKEAKMSYAVGCDQHKHYSIVTAKDKDGNLMDQTKLYHNSRDSIVDYFSSLPKDSSVLLEATGFDPWLCDLIQECGLNVKLAHPFKTRAIAEEKIKTDKLSSGVLADLLRANLVCEAYIASPEIREKRYNLRYRQYLIHLRTTAKNRIHSLLSRLGLQTPDITDLFGKAGREYLKELNLGPTYQRALTGCLCLIDEFTTLIKDIDSGLRKELKEEPLIQLLMTIPGIGLILAHLILSEIADINRFLSSSKLASYCGIVPSLHQSGKVRYSGNITKEGNRYLLWAFVEAAHTAIRMDPYLARFYRKIHSKKGPHVAIVAVAHKLLTATYWILKKHEPYRFRAIDTGRAR